LGGRAAAGPGPFCCVWGVSGVLSLSGGVDGDALGMDREVDRSAGREAAGGDVLRREVRGEVLGVHAEEVAVRGEGADGAGEALAGADEVDSEIGRASCR